MLSNYARMRCWEKSSLTSWLDMKLPCVHACCWAWKHRNIRYDTFVKDYMEDVHSVDFLQNLYSQNINPIVTDNIEYDLTSKPNPTVRMSGRPPVQRIRNRSRYANPDDSPTICSICNRCGHNQWTCQHWWVASGQRQRNRNQPQVNSDIH